MEKWKKYQRSMWDRAWQDTSSVYGGSILMMILAQIAVIPLAALVSFFFGESGNWLPQILAAIIALFPIIGMLVLQRIITPIKIFDEQTRKLELKAYDDVEIYYSPLAETLDEKRAERHSNTPIESRRLSYFVKNNGLVRIRECRIKMTNLILKDSPHNYYEDVTKLRIEDNSIRWKNSNNERIDLGAGSFEPIILAKIPDFNAIPIFHFIVFGEAKNNVNENVPRTFEGTWQVDLQIEGQAEKNGIVIDLDPIGYTISFRFENFSLTPIAIKKHERLNLSKKIKSR